MSPFTRLVALIWQIIESDSVRPFIPLYYIPWLIWGILATTVFPPIAIIEETMGHPGYVLWVWSTICGTSAAVTGLLMRHGGEALISMSKPLLARDWMGLCLQCGGHSCMCVLLILFEISAITAVLDRSAEGTYAGMTLFAAFVLSSYLIGTGLLALQCLRKLWMGEQLKRRLQ